MKYQQDGGGKALSRRQALLLGACLIPVAQGCSPFAAVDRASETSVASPPTLAPPSSPVAIALPPTAVVPVPGNPPTTPLLCRQAWGAAPVRPGGKTHTLDRMTLHHSAELFTDNRTITKRLRDHQHVHQVDNGWIDIAYHVAVDRKGNLFELRPAELVGDTNTDYDPTGHFLVLVEGNFEEQKVEESQIAGASLAFAWAAQKYGISTKTLAGHRDVPAATACPGSNLEAFITNGELRERIESILAEGPVPVELVCGPAADDVVRKIESGE